MGYEWKGCDSVNYSELLPKPNNVDLSGTRPAKVTYCDGDVKIMEMNQQRFDTYKRSSNDEFSIIKKIEWEKRELIKTIRFFTAKFEDYVGFSEWVNVSSKISSEESEPFNIISVISHDGYIIVTYSLLYSESEDY